MIIEYDKNGRMTATPQNNREANLLTELDKRLRAHTEGEGESQPPKRRKKRQVRKPCEFCGQIMKGKLGMSVHVRSAHPDRVVVGTGDVPRATSVV